MERAVLERLADAELVAASRPNSWEALLERRGCATGLLASLAVGGALGGSSASPGSVALATLVTWLLAAVGLRTASRLRRRTALAVLRARAGALWRANDPSELSTPPSGFPSVRAVLLEARLGLPTDAREVGVRLDLEPSRGVLRIRRRSLRRDEELPASRSVALSVDRELSGRELSAWLDVADGTCLRDLREDGTASAVLDGLPCKLTVWDEVARSPKVLHCNLAAGRARPGTGSRASELCSRLLALVPPEAGGPQDDPGKGRSRPTLRDG